MRGFDYNIRNGNSYALINTEIRFPVFATLINAPIRSEFIRNFQLVGFTDVGTAWEGKNPFAHDNPLFQETIREGNSPIAVNVYQYRSPVVAGYGFGFRTSIFGYFVRTDLAWGYDGNKVTGPKVHFSFNLDF
jgi:outer membrane protein assembly factor BamA